MLAYIQDSRIWHRDISASADLHDGLRSVSIANAFQFACNLVQSLVPVNALKLALSSLPYSLHGIHNPIGVMDLLLQGITQGTGSELGLRSVVGHYPGNDAALGMNVQQADSATVLANHCLLHRLIAVPSCHGRSSFPAPSTFPDNTAIGSSHQDRPPALA